LETSDNYAFQRSMSYLYSLHPIVLCDEVINRCNVSSSAQQHFIALLYVILLLYYTIVTICKPNHFNNK
jgi:hypothetical protein